MMMMMKKVSTTIIFISMISALFMEADSQTDSCTSNLDLSGLGLGFNTTSLNCVSVWASHDYILRYSQSGNTEWDFVLSVPNVDTYVAIGFSTNGGMVGSSAVVGWMSATGAGTIKQYKLDGQTSSMVKPDEGDLVINTSTILSQSGRTFLAFRLITVEQPRSQLLYALGPSNFLPSAPGFALAQHRDRVSTSITYVPAAPPPPSTESTPSAAPPPGTESTPSAAPPPPGTETTPSTAPPSPTVTAESPKSDAASKFTFTHSFSSLLIALIVFKEIILRH